MIKVFKTFLIQTNQVKVDRYVSDPYVCDLTLEKSFYSNQFCPVFFLYPYSELKTLTLKLIIETANTNRGIHCVSYLNRKDLLNLASDKWF